MPVLSFTKGKELGLLPQKEIERFAILYLAMADEIKPTAKVFGMAAVQAGNTEKSFRVILGNTLRKLREKECYVEGTKDGGEVVDSATTTPKATPRKRKAGDEDVGSSGVKKAARGKKAVEPKAVKMEDGDEEKAVSTSERGTERIA